MQTASQIRFDVRLRFGEALRIEDREGDAELTPDLLRTPDFLVHGLPGPEDLDPAGGADEVGGVRLARNGHVLRDAVLDQRRIEPGDLFMPGGTRMPPVLEQEGRDPWQRREVIMGVGGVVQRIAEQRREIVREAVREDALALDQAGVAE